jgi:hypothetical protein
MKKDNWSIAKKAFSALFIISVMMIVALGGCTAKTTTTPPVITTAPPETSAPFTPVITTTPPVTTPTVTLTPTTPPPTSTTPPTTAPATPQTILSITGGDVFVMRAGTTNWVVATEDMTLQPGDSIRSKAGSTAEVTFFEGSTIELKGDTQISLAEISLSDTGSTTIHLKQIVGETVSRVKKLTDSASTYEVETQAAVAAVRGSTMELTVLADGTTIVENIEGDIHATAQGVDVTIPVGYKVTIIPGQAPGQPELIATPTPTPTPTVAPPGPGPQIVYIARVSTAVHASSTTAFVGDTVTYSYTITNIGNVGLSSVGAMGTITGPATLSNGDVNGNSLLDPGETWVLVASHVVTAVDPLELVNIGTFTVTVPQNLNTYTLSDQVTVYTSPKTGIKIILTWNTNDTDIDSHLIRPGGEYESYSDCFYDNLSPDWGEYGHPSLDHDNTTGYGPEQTKLTDPGTGTYHFMVDYYSGSIDTIATVQIYLNGVLAATYSKTLHSDEDPPWDCAVINWSSATHTGTVTQPQANIAVTKTPSATEVYAGESIT